MSRILAIRLAILAATLAVVNAENLALSRLPAAARKTIRDQTRGAKITNISKETERGVEQYEVQTMINGKHRDFSVDTNGALLSVEEETTIDSIPPAARAAISKKVADGKLGMVELFKRGGETLYEAAYTTKNGKKREVLVKADGTETKE